MASQMRGAGPQQGTGSHNTTRSLPIVGDGRDAALQRFLDAMSSHGRRYRGPDSQGWYDGQCPNGGNHKHDDADMSFRFMAGDRGIITTCHGCPAIHDDTCAALGIDVTDTFYETKPARTEFTYYNYTDAEGTVLYRKVRTGWAKPKPKHYFQHPEGAGWVNTRGCQPVLYNLPAVLAGVVAGAKIVVAEGEKDCNAIIARGEIATCNDNGAGHWRDEYSEVLAGAMVVIIADDDAAGTDHARAVAASLLRQRCKVAIFLPAKGCKDAADHFAAGHEFADFVPWRHRPEVLGKPGTNGHHKPPALHLVKPDCCKVCHGELDPVLAADPDGEGMWADEHATCGSSDWSHAFKGGA